MWEGGGGEEQEGGDTQRELREGFPTRSCVVPTLQLPLYSHQVLSEGVASVCQGGGVDIASIAFL